MGGSSRGPSARWRRWLAAAAIVRSAAASQQQDQDVASGIAVSAPVPSPLAKKSYLDITYASSMQPLVEVQVGSQKVHLVFDASSGNTILFVKEKDACSPTDLSDCYSYVEATASGSLKVCQENMEEGRPCGTAGPTPYHCEEFLTNKEDRLNHAHNDALMIDGVQYDQSGVEGLEDFTIVTSGPGGTTHSFASVPTRLLVEAMKVNKKEGQPEPVPDIELFQGVGGIFGASGPTLSCRNTTLWNELIQEESVVLVSLDFEPPPQATIQNAQPRSSTVAFNTIDPLYVNKLVWSQPKQTGDIFDDGMSEFLIFDLQVCGVDMLYNTSSNWLTVIDTSGPCFMLPPFLYDRLMTRIPVKCPFELGTPSLGRLCSPSRPDGKGKLPTISFALEDASTPGPPRLHLNLERLVFKDAQGNEKLCVTRDDTESGTPTAEMMYSHISLGSMAVASFYTTINLANHSIGLASKGDPATESSEANCAKDVTCTGMQTYFPPMNLCEDPVCSEFMFMTLDEDTKVCRWSRLVPTAFGILLAALAILDLAGHHIYQKAVVTASQQPT